MNSPIDPKKEQVAIAVPFQISASTSPNANKLKCSNGQLGCQWSGTQLELFSHLVLCDYQMLPCKQCGNPFVRRELVAHSNMCNKMEQPTLPTTTNNISNNNNVSAPTSSNKKRKSGANSNNSNDETAMLKARVESLENLVKMQQERLEYQDRALKMQQHQVYSLMLQLRGPMHLPIPNSGDMPSSGKGTNSIPI